MQLFYGKISLPLKTINTVSINILLFSCEIPLPQNGGLGMTVALMGIGRAKTKRVHCTRFVFALRLIKAYMSFRTQ